MIDFLIKNIKELVTVDDRGLRFKTGSQMRDISIIAGGAVAIEGDRILWAGPSLDLPTEYGEAHRIVDADGMVALPGLVDPHTHIIFAGTREGEFEERILGRTYAEIAAAGGGILSTVRATRAASREELVDLAKPRLDRMLAFGVTTAEVKSGYGLATADEIKMLEAAAELDTTQSVALVPTFLGAHEVPLEYRGDRDAYVDLVVREMIPEVSRRGLARFCDVFCETGVYDLRETERILAAGLAHGLRPRLHADQLSPLGGAALAGRIGAASADHLEHISDEGISAMKEGGTVAVLLPGASFFLGISHPPARRVIDAGLPVALATDCNPGSSMSENLVLMMTIACCQMRMTPAEAISAVTLNAAAALDLSREIGSIQAGKRADLVLFDAPGHRYIPYHYGANHARLVVKSGKIVVGE